MPKNAIDGNTGTRWESAYSDPQWLYVDLGAVKTVTEVRIDWQHAAAKDYRIDVSNDAVTWSAAIVTKTGLPAVDHRIDDLTGLSATGRYVRMYVYGTARDGLRLSRSGSSSVSGFDAASCATGATNLLTAGWDSLDRVHELSRRRREASRSAPRRTPSPSTTPSQTFSITAPANTPTPIVRGRRSR